MVRNPQVISVIVSISLLLCSIQSFAGGEVKKSPILDRVNVVYKAPENMDELNLEQLQHEKSIREHDLRIITEASDDPKLAKQKLLETILEHDDKRLNIANVIPILIDEYEIKGEFREDLLGYSETFNVEMREARTYVHSLDDYKSYDFRFSAVYMSMMFKFKENPDFHKKMVADMKDPDTTMGKYLEELDDSYKKVEHNKYLIQNIYSVDELKQAIAQIDAEIAKRERVEL